jgi:hypothetical protein
MMLPDNEYGQPPWPAYTATTKIEPTNAMQQNQKGYERGKSQSGGKLCTEK